MSGNRPTALMTQYAEGVLISRDLQQMMVDYAAEVRFDRELAEDIDLWTDRKTDTRYGVDNNE